MPFNVGTQPMLPPTGPQGQDLSPRYGQPPDLMSLLRQIAAQKGIPVEMLIEELKRRQRAMTEAMARQPGGYASGGPPEGAGASWGGGEFGKTLFGGDIASLIGQAMSGMKR